MKLETGGAVDVGVWNLKIESQKAPGDFNGFHLMEKNFIHRNSLLGILPGWSFRTGVLSKLNVICLPNSWNKDTHQLIRRRKAGESFLDQATFRIDF